MLPWIPLDTAPMPGGGELRLKRRGSEFSIMLGAIELMNSRLSGSEEALATLACARIAGLKAPTVLIGGLGMGFTLRAALAALGPEGRIVVVELVPAVVAWARGPMAEIFAGSLDDPRVAIREADVGAVIDSQRAAFDAVLLDVDNGPEGLSREANDALYSIAGLSAARAALRPGGVLGVWSQGPDRGSPIGCARSASRSRRCACVRTADAAAPGTWSGWRRSGIWTPGRRGPEKLEQDRTGTGRTDRSCSV